MPVYTLISAFEIKIRSRRCWVNWKYFNESSSITNSIHHVVIGTIRSAEKSFFVTRQFLQNVLLEDKKRLFSLLNVLIGFRQRTERSA